MDNETKKQGPFAGLLVVDLTHVLSGPFATNILCDLGARVIKIEEPPDGDESRYWGPFVKGESLEYSFVNRGKESIMLDLTKEDDKTIFLNMVKQADILAENFRPGTMEKLGFSYEVLSALNPRLIYASLSGFGQSGAASQFPAYDTIIQAMSGLMMQTGFPDGPPVRAGTSVVDMSTGLYLFGGIVTALYARNHSGRGAHVDIAMFDSAVSFLEQGLLTYLATGVSPGRVGNRDLYISPFDIYKTKDKYIAICCGNDHLFAKLCSALDLSQLITDSRFATNQERVIHENELKTILEKKLMNENADHWLKVIDKVGVPAGPILTVEEAMKLPEIHDRKMLVESGGVMMPGMPIKISGFPDSSTRPPAPKLNQEGTSLREEFGNRQK